MLLITIALLAGSALSQEPDIVYKYSSGYEVIWTDSGSSADRDGSIWRAKNYQSEYCSLGDVANSGHGTPTDKAVLVSMKKAGALVHPSSFTQIWNDGGSDASADVAVYRMNAPSGYTCLGSVAMRSHSAQPDKTKYCCVKNDFVTRGEFVITWNDAGSKADRDVSWWSVIRGEDVYGLDAGNFQASSNYGAPASGYLLKSDGEKVRDVWSMPENEVKPLNLYEVSDVKLIWNDAGSSADSDCSIWRVETMDGYYPVGDIVVNSHSKPTIAFLMKPSSKAHYDAIAGPISYSAIWRDSGSSAEMDVTVWRVNCPGGYVSLGNVATSGGFPQIGDVYCLKSEYATRGYNSGNNWKAIWADHGSKAHSDVTMFEAKAYTSAQQSVRGMGAIASHSGYPGYPYFLRKDAHNYYAEKPIEKIEMFNVRYNLDAEKQQTAPAKMSPTVIENHSDREQAVSRTITFSTAESSTFTFSQAIQVGVAVELTAGLPAIGISSKTTISVVSTTTFVYGSTTTETRTDSVTAAITLPARSKITAIITAREFKADIPYTARVRKWYFDGTSSYANVSGVYKGVAIAEAAVNFGEIEYFQ